LDDIGECLESVFSLGLSGLEVVVVDNASSGSVVDYLKGLEDDGKIKLVLNDVNYGFTYAVNQGIALADPGSDILIMNNDAILTPGAVEALQASAYDLPDCGITVPEQVLPGGTKTISTHVPFAYPNFDCDVNLSAHHRNVKYVPVFHSGDVVELNFAPFFCAYIRRDVLDDSVGLDAEFGRHYRSDRIFCDYLQYVMGLKIYYVADAVVYHKLQKSTEVLRDDKTDKFSVMFQKNQWEPELAQKLGYQKPKWDQ
jgi:GT2 family glycosyltransferase